MTRCYEVKLGSQEEAITYELSPDKIFPSPWPDTVWDPYENPSCTSKGILSEEWKHKVSDFWMLIQPKVKVLPNVIGGFSHTQSNPAVVDEITKNLINRMDHNLCDFAPVRKIWDIRFNREIKTPRYYFASVRRSLSSWDPEQTEIVEIPKVNGTMHLIANPPLVVRETIIKDELLWRDSTTGHVMCTEKFKNIIEASGSLGFWFYQIGVSAR